MSGYGLLRPLLFALPAGFAHALALRVLDGVRRFPGWRIWRRFLLGRFPARPCMLGGVRLENPIGLAAGFDKDGRWIEALLELGFGWVEIGSVTLHPQDTLRSPRIHRLRRSQALINRLGLPSEGAEIVARRLAHLRSRHPEAPVGVNIALNRDLLAQADPERCAAGYADCARLLYPYAHWIVLNLSCPNAEGLKRLHSTPYVERIAQAVAALRCELTDPAGAALPRRSLWLKLSPDVAPSLYEACVEAALEHKLDGFSTANTTTQRDLPELRGSAWPPGGLSGTPLTPIALRTLHNVREILVRRGAEKQLSIIACGGVRSAADAQEMLRAGASAVQLYTGLIYEGPGLVGRILRDWAPQQQRSPAAPHPAYKAALQTRSTALRPRAERRPHIV